MGTSSTSSANIQQKPKKKVYKKMSKNFSQSYVAPQTIEELLNQGWGERIYSRIRRFVLYDVCNNEDDLFQDIICLLLSTKYLERYNAEYNSFEAYLYIFVDNYLKRKFTRENTKNGKNIVTRSSLEISVPSDDYDYEPGVIFLETLLDATATVDSMDFNLNLQALKKKLSLKYKASSYVLYNGVEIPRDPTSVLQLLEADMTVAEIAEVFKTSKQFVYSLIKKVRELVPEYFDYAPRKSR